MLASRTVEPHTDLVTDPDSSVVRGLQKELVYSDIASQMVYPFTKSDEFDPLNQAFSWKNFSVALSSCKAKSFPVMDGLSYAIIQGFSEPVQRFLYNLFN